MLQCKSPFMAIRDRLLMSRFLPLCPRKPTHEQPLKCRLERVAQRHLVFGVLATDNSDIDQHINQARVDLDLSYEGDRVVLRVGAPAVPHSTPTPRAQRRLDSGQ